MARTSAQVDLFLHQLVDAPVKDTQELMEFPFFSLQKQKRTTPYEYDDGAVSITITPGPHGMATIWDKDILMYLASLLNDIIERGDLDPGRTITFPAYDFLTATGRGTGKRAYELFLDALRRLRSTTVETSIVTGDQVDRRGFGWIDAWHVIEQEDGRGRKVMRGVEVTIADWMYRAVAKDKNVLTIDYNYFDLKSGIDRRLYELARKHTGRKANWWISLPRLYDKVGLLIEPGKNSASTRPYIRKFRAHVKSLQKSQLLPEYEIDYMTPPVSDCPFKVKPSTEMVRFTRRHMDALPPPPDISDDDDHDGPPRITQDAYEQACGLYPDYDISYIEGKWQEYANARGDALRNADKAFLGFARSYVAQNPIR